MNKKETLFCCVVALVFASTSAIDEVGECTAVGEYKPDPKDCTSFYHCDGNGNLVKKQCGPGTEWNQELLICDNPTGNCKYPESTQKPTDVPTEETEPEGNGGQETTEPEIPETERTDEPTEETVGPTQETDEPEGTGEPETESTEGTEVPESTEGPEESETTEVTDEPETTETEAPSDEDESEEECINGYKSNPKNCSTFFYCAYDLNIELSCPNNLLWNKDALACDWPWNVDCKDKAPLECVHEELSPNLKNCSTFLQCVHGTYVTMPCPTGLRWNSTANICDWPENSDCQEITEETTTVEIIES